MSFYRPGQWWVHGGADALEGDRLDVRKSRAGGIFLAKDDREGRIYASGYARGGFYRCRIDLPEDSIFDLTNPDHVDRIRETEVDGATGEDMLRSMAHGPSDSGHLDWAVVDAEILEAAGFRGAILHERPAGFHVYSQHVLSLVLWNSDDIAEIQRIPGEELAQAQQASYRKPSRVTQDALLLLRRKYLIL